jgi:hypothetical protein
MIVRDIVPRSAIRTIALPHRPPSPLAEIRAPPFSVGAAVPSLCKSPLLMGEGALCFARRRLLLCVHSLSLPCLGERLTQGPEGGGEQHDVFEEKLAGHR